MSHWMSAKKELIQNLYFVEASYTLSVKRNLQ